MNQFLVPANSKKSRLIFGFFTPRDLIVCAIGGTLTFNCFCIATFNGGNTCLPNCKLSQCYATFAKHI